MDVKLIVAGLAMGLATSAPLGPVNVMVIHEALRRGVLAGIITGLGAVAADTVFAALAAFSLKTVAEFFTGHAVALSLAGGTLLVAIGIGTARQPMSLADAEASRGTGPGLARPLAALATTITNPGALVGAFAVFGGMANVLQLPGGPWRPALAVLAFAAGGALWWLALSLLIGRLRGRMSEAMLNRINRWSGVIIAAFGFVVLMNAFG
jgi:threonine/homoserine/homoserine lactone efflux protein